MTNEQAQQLLGEIAGYLETLRNDPHSTTFVPLCDVYLQLGMLEEAMSVARHGIEALPFFGPGYVVFGRAQKQYGELDRAFESFRKALEVDPDSLPALKNLSKLCVLRGDRVQACSFLARAIDLDPADPTLANLHKSLHSVEVASLEADKDELPCGSANESLFATATVADLYVRQGHLDKAQTIYRELLDAQPDDQSLRERLAQVDALLAEQSPLTATDVSSEALVDTVAEVRASDTPRNVVAVLQHWLLAIQARREYVQKHFAGHC